METDVPAPKTDGPTSVYIIAAGDCVKIGMSSDPERRVRDMVTAMHETPKLIASREFPCRLHARRAEGIVHWSLMRYRVRERGEWFKVSHSMAKAALTKARLPDVVV
jgi:hypothetical protein